MAERDVPIVALTGHSRSLAEKALEAGATSYVLKPFGKGEVVHAVQEAIVIGWRRESRSALAGLLDLLGYPEEWSVAFESRAFERGQVWRRFR